MYLHVRNCKKWQIFIVLCLVTANLAFIQPKSNNTVNPNLLD